MVTGDLNFTFGKYGQVWLYRASIDGTLDFTPRGSRASTLRQSQRSSRLSAATRYSIRASQPTESSISRFARISHTLSFNHARFFGTQENGLDAERAIVQEAIYWVAITLTPRTMLDLDDARANLLGDDQASWPAPGNLLLDGFEYNGFSANSPSDADSRLKWLAHQPAGYRRQPYAQLAKVFSDQGENEDATTVEIAQRVAERREGGLRWAAWAWNAMLQATIGYGFVPLRALWWIAGFVAFGTCVFHWGYVQRIVAPTRGGSIRLVHAKRKHATPLSALQRLRVFIGELLAHRQPPPWRLLAPQSLPWRGRPHPCR